MTDTTLLPGANSPQMLTRMLETVSRGVRTTRGLQEALGVGVQTVRAYVHAAAWLSLVESTDPVELSPLGLEYVYAGPRRAQVWARAVWSNALAADLLIASDGRVPDLDAVERTLLGTETGLADATIRRRASAVRGLLAPAVGRARPRLREEEERQLGLALAQRAAVEPPPALEQTTGEYDPDAYRYVLACLLDHGELGLGHLRALLDRAGAPGLGIGGLLDLALTRGDAVRIGERLVVTRGAVERRDLANDTTHVILSDPTFRTSLYETSQLSRDRDEAIRRYHISARFREWSRRLFGRPVELDEVPAALERVLRERPLSAFPVAHPATETPTLGDGAFLDQWEQSGLRIALPPSFGQLQGGVAAANRLLKQARQSSPVGLPDLADRPLVVHAGILHPGEPLPRSIPDARTLRQRVLMHAPYATVVSALLLVHRLSPDRVALTDERNGWVVRRPGDDAVPLLDWIDRFARARGWLAVRRPGAGTPPASLVSTLESLGIATIVGRGLVLAEGLFSQLQSEAEEREVLSRLRPLGDAVEAHLDLDGAVESSIEPTS
jgi:hypothetical protein